MPKHEFGTPKDISKRMKAKGLQKLRWYCQMCQKQCRDENGFKCHTMSESHQRQLLLFADNSKKYLGEFSHEFEKGFMDIVRRRFRTKRVHANQVYQEYISDRNHVHMNATSWHSLTGFVKYLGRTGKCIVDETEKGWYLTYIDRDPDTLAAEQKREKKRKMDKDDEEKIMDFVNRQVELNQILNPPSETEYTELKRQNEEEPLKLGIQLKIKDEPLVEKESINDDVKSVFGDEKKVAKRKEVKKLTTLDELMLEQESKRERENRKDYWLHEGIVVKVITKSLGDKFYKEKGYVKEVLDKYCCIVKMFDLGQLLKLDQNHLETVIPAIGREVKIVNGAYRGSIAMLTGICQEKFCASLSINKGPFLGKQLKNVSYEDICKLYVPPSDDKVQ